MHLQGQDRPAREGGGVGSHPPALNPRPALAVPLGVAVGGRPFAFILPTGQPRAGWGFLWLAGPLQGLPSLRPLLRNVRFRSKVEFLDF